jgi:hypothetical protein
MQRSVAASASRLYFSWTDNRRHRGFDTYNKITDWNLLGIADPPTAYRPPPTAFAVQVWPSVLSGDGLVRLEVTPGAPVTVDILDVSGRRVGNLLVGAASQPRVAYRLPHLSSGAYFVVARSGEKKAITKICVMEKK